MEFKLADLEVKPKAEDGTFEGYGAVFNNEDDGGDLIKPGAFKTTLARMARERRMPKMFLNHAGMPNGTTRANDLIPVGVWRKAAEDSKGLAVEGKLINLDTERGKMIQGAMKEKALDGLSIGFKPTDFSYRANGGRTLNQIDVFEISIVTYPMQREARIASAKFMPPGPALVGVAVAYDKPLLLQHPPRNFPGTPPAALLFKSGCFGRFLSDVSVTVDHEWGPFFGCEGAGTLELHDEGAALAYKIAAAPGSPGRPLFDRAKRREFTGISIGWRPGEIASQRLRDGRSVAVFDRATLDEISVVHVRCTVGNSLEAVADGDAIDLSRIAKGISPKTLEASANISRGLCRLEGVLGALAA